MAMHALVFAEGIANGLRQADALDAEGRRWAGLELAKEIERRYAKSGAYPASLEQMANAAGFEHTRFLAKASHVRYRVAGPLFDGVAWFYRSALAIGSPGTDFDAYWQKSSCGGSGFAMAESESWCGAEQGVVWRASETRADYQARILSGRRQLNETLRKFIAYWNANQAFPSAGLSAGAATDLKALAGYGGGAESCSGAYALDGVPLECQDFFTPWGSPVAYNYLSDRRIALAAGTSSLGAKAYSKDGKGEWIAAEMYY